MLLELIIKIGTLKRNKQKFLRLLAKLEYGLAAFCSKLKDQASEEGLVYLETMLCQHQKEEYNHGLMLSTCGDGKNRISPDRVGATGRWVKILKDQENLTAKNITNNIPATIQTKTIEWDSIKYPGEKLKGVFESFDGISFRYLALRLLFRNQPASSYSWIDKLAFMSVLEEATGAFYRRLMNVDDAGLSAIAAKIAGDEFNHANYLVIALNAITNSSEETQKAIQKWRDRIYWSKFGLIFDVIKFVVF